MKNLVDQIYTIAETHLRNRLVGRHFDLFMITELIEVITSSIRQYRDEHKIEIVIAVLNHLYLSNAVQDNMLLQPAEKRVKMANFMENGLTHYVEMVDLTPRVAVADVGCTSCFGGGRVVPPPAVVAAPLAPVVVAPVAEPLAITTPPAEAPPSEAESPMPPPPSPPPPPPPINTIFDPTSPDKNPITLDIRETQADLAIVAVSLVERMPESSTIVVSPPSETRQAEETYEKDAIQK